MIGRMDGFVLYNFYIISFQLAVWVMMIRGIISSRISFHHHHYHHSILHEDIGGMMMISGILSSRISFHHHHYNHHSIIHEDIGGMMMIRGIISSRISFHHHYHHSIILEDKSIHFSSRVHLIRVDFNRNKMESLACYVNFWNVEFSLYSIVYFMYRSATLCT